MKYFFDTEFHEYKKKPLFGKPIDTIELISIGIVSEKVDKWKHITNKKIEEKTKNIIHEELKREVYPQKEYYAICKDFDLKAAWNNEWLRENVLEPIHWELITKEVEDNNKAFRLGIVIKSDDKFTYKNFKRLINKYGKTKKQIAEEIIEFTDASKGKDVKEMQDLYNPEFYAYYADYDWVVFCSLWKEVYPADNKVTGMSYINPKGFPYYCKDLKQIKDDWKQRYLKEYPNADKELFELEAFEQYPKQTNEHNALAGAKWNYKLYKFIKSL